MFDCDFSWIQDTFELTGETGDDCAVFGHKTNGNRLYEASEHKVIISLFD